MMKTLLPELIKNPKLFQNLMQFAEMTNKPKSNKKEIIIIVEDEIC